MQVQHSVCFCIDVGTSLALFSSFDHLTSTKNILLQQCDKKSSPFIQGEGKNENHKHLNFIFFLHTCENWVEKQAQQTSAVNNSGT